MEKIPVKNKRLVIMDYKGLYYGTIDNEKMFELEKITYEVLKRCDGNKTIRQIVNELAKIGKVEPEKLDPIVRRMLKELEGIDFISWA